MEENGVTKRSDKIPRIVRRWDPLKPDLFVYLDGSGSMSSRIVQGRIVLKEILSSFKDVPIHVIIFDDKNSCEGGGRRCRNSVPFDANINATNHIRGGGHGGSRQSNPVIFQNYYPQGLNPFDLENIFTHWIARGGTYIWERIVDDVAVNVGPNEKIELLLITDGEDNYYGKEGFQNVLVQFLRDQNRSVVLHIVLMGEQGLINQCETYCQSTGGSFAFISDQPIQMVQYINDGLNRLKEHIAARYNGKR